MSKPRKQADEEKAERTDENAAAEATEAEETAAREDANADEIDGDGADGEEPEAEPDPLDVLRAERAAFEEKWLRAVAEMENVRRRARKEVQDARRFAQADLLRPMLDVYDNFERALQSAGGEGEGEGGIREGVDLIFQRFRSILKEKGVVRIEAMDKEFDPRVHEAVGTLAREGAEDGTVIEVVQPGFQMGDFVLRPARVIVAG